MHEMKNQIAVSNQSLIEEINTRQMLLGTLKVSVEQNCLDSANAIREMGVYLAKLKQDTRHGDWLGLFASSHGEPNAQAVLRFDSNTAGNYMRFAKANPEPFTDPAQAMGAYREIYKSAGLILTGSSTGDAKRITPPDGWLSDVLDGVIKIGRSLDKHDLANAPRAQQDILIERIRPIVQMFVQMGGKLE